ERLLLRRPRCEPAHSRALALGYAEQEREIAHDTTSSSARRGRNGAGVTLTGLRLGLQGTDRAAGSATPSITLAFAPASRFARNPSRASIACSSCSSDIALTLPVCSTCISRGTSKTNSLRNTAG